MKEDNKHYKHLKNIAQWLDNKFEGPFGFKFGLDPIIGLIPVVGDLITVFLSVYILFNAYLLGCSFPVFIRMLFNIGLDFVIKVIPILGIAFDFVWKANIKNIQLLEAHLENPQGTRRQSLIMIIVGMITLFLFLVFCLAITIAVLSFLIGMISRYMERTTS